MSELTPFDLLLTMGCGGALFVLGGLSVVLVMRRQQDRRRALSDLSLLDRQRATLVAFERRLESLRAAYCQAEAVGDDDRCAQLQQEFGALRLELESFLAMTADEMAGHPSISQSWRLELESSFFRVGRTASS